MGELYVSKLNKKIKKPNYFSEKDIVNLVSDYKINKNNITFQKMSKPIEQMIEGMINKEFYFNDIVKNNKSDIKSECFVEILKSLENYDPERGRVFAYLNRIVKNTILRCYNKNKKINNKEMTYTNFSKNQNEEIDDDIVLNLGSYDYHNEETFSEQETIQSIGSKKSLSSQESYYVIYHYIKQLKDNIIIYINDSELREKLLEDIKSDANVVFDFSKYSQTNLLTDKLVFSRILSYLNITLSKLIKWIEKNHLKCLSIEPISFNARIQQRTINTIKNYVNEFISHSKLTSYYSIEDMIQLIRYIMDRNIKYDIVAGDIVVAEVQLD
jgi:hypothetical protein